MFIHEYTLSLWIKYRNIFSRVYTILFYKYKKFNAILYVLKKEKDKLRFKRVWFLPVFSIFFYLFLYQFLPKNEPSWTMNWVFLFKVNFIIAVITSLYQSYSYDVYYTILLLLFSISSRLRMILWIIIKIYYDMQI